MVIWALCGRFCVLIAPHYWSRNGWSSWLCFYYTPLQNQLCYATWVTYTWVALLLRRPFLAIAIESCFVHPWRNQVVDHSKLKTRDGVFWIEVYQRLSKFAHTQMEKVCSRIILVHNNFFLSYVMFACFNVMVLCYYFFFNFCIIILVDRKCWLCGHSHLYITQGQIIGSAEALPILCVRYFWWER